ncbi:MAG: DegT/DnrJ/EryC1/StrS family aminotransferase [Flavobacterium sp.]|nr:DegT/DnrJ/EryC1/StrS family aminotransferase [Flavobacterium sp.]
MINVTKSFLPPIEEYQEYLAKIWDSSHLTNQGPLVKELEGQLKKHLGVENLLFVSNGTIALQLAIKALDLKGEIITTPFSYVATTTSILWENCTPVFADIDPQSFCINPSDIENHITPNTSAILATHVYGYSCDVIKIEEIAKKHNLKVIYDGAHAFGVNVYEKSIFNYGDISTISFHATKLYHTVEGGAIIVKNAELAQKLYLYRSFGHIADNYYTLGINGKNSEFHAAMGLCNLPKVENIMENRKQTVLLYKKLLDSSKLFFPQKHPNQELNYAYFPVVFENENVLLKVKGALANQDINTRRYFYPSLNNLPYLTKKSNCPVSDDLSLRVLCLPLFYDINHVDVERICKIINITI